MCFPLQKDHFVLVITRNANKAHTYVHNVIIEKIKGECHEALRSLIKNGLEVETRDGWKAMGNVQLRTACGHEVVQLRTACGHEVVQPTGMNTSAQI
jgi:hypothetical protein